MNKIILICFMMMPGLAFAFDTFNSESAKVSAGIACPKPKINPGDNVWSPLYTCIGGSAETVKFFINGIAGSTKVDDVKFLWNDWTKDIGHGVHADAAIAKSWVAAMATMYAPHKVGKVINAFFGSKNTTIKDGPYLLKYTYHVGPAIDERMFIVHLEK